MPQNARLQRQQLLPRLGLPLNTASPSRRLIQSWASAADPLAFTSRQHAHGTRVGYAVASRVLEREGKCTVPQLECIEAHHLS